MNTLKYGNVVLIILSIGFLVFYKLSTDSEANGPLMRHPEKPVVRLFEFEIETNVGMRDEFISKSQGVNSSANAASNADYETVDRPLKIARESLSLKSAYDAQSVNEPEVDIDNDDEDLSIADIWEDREEEDDDEWRVIEEDYTNSTWTWDPKAYSDWRNGLEDYGVDSMKNFILSHESVEVTQVLPFYLSIKDTYTISERFMGLLPKKSPYDDKSLGKCAVVGNSGVLKHSGCGKNIDSADYIFRCNIPPLVEYMNDVGEKTNLTTMNPSMLESQHGTIAFLRQRDYPFNLVLEPYNGVILLSCFSHSFFLQNCIKAVQQYYRKNANMTFLNPQHFNLVWDYWKERGKLNLPSTGFYIVNTAVTMCDSVDVYGFWPFARTGFSGEPERVMYHYYEEGAARPAHDMIGEFRFLYKLHKEGALRVHLGNCSVT